MAEKARGINKVKLKKLFDKKYSKVKWIKPIFNVGDQVRLFKDKGRFGRSYDTDYTTEIFIINKVFTNMPIPRYQLKDKKENIIMGNAQQNEIILAYIPPSST